MTLYKVAQSATGVGEEHRMIRRAVKDKKNKGSGYHIYAWSDRKERWAKV